ncbi:YibE/F family protein [Desulforamulus aquiferis]|uniref:YibE/F family protein n=1 Tax=Desulforamulus aquiferis TaxID=1397668 RepID=A0AAW7ZAB1_9FIRM|nr:YibE/F family protein [Desulforamulus aquiferis]MDO7786363.1 YibE/F family protein [Desulforamulus aquiferis]
MKRFAILPILMLILSLLFAGQVLANENDIHEPAVEKEVIVRAKVLKVIEGQEIDPVMEGWVQDKEQILTVKMLSGDFKGEELILTHMVPAQLGMAVIVNPGDEVVLSLMVDEGKITGAFVSDFARDKKLYYLTGFFALIMIVIGGIKGLKSVISLGVTGAGIFYILLPMLFKGYDPILSTVFVAAVLTSFTMILVHGFNIKTFSGIIGTTSGVVVAGVLAMLVGKAARLTGFSSEEMQMLLYIPQQVDFNFQGLLFAGMIIGALGAVMDVGISVASAIEEVRRVNPLLKMKELTQAGMNVGRDIMGTMANTLILAYTGGAIPLILIFMAYEMPFLKIINLDLIATEIVRALTGSIGLILAIPITAVASGMLFTRFEKNDKPAQKKK